MQDGEVSCNGDVEHIEGFLKAELDRGVDLVAAYKKWKDQREFPWFYKEWLHSPSYPIKLRPGQTFDSRRLEQIIRDFGFKRPTVVTARGSAALPFDQLTALRKMLTNLIARQTSSQPQQQQQQQPQAVVVAVSPVVVTPKTAAPPPSPQSLPVRLECDDSERMRVEKVLQGVLKDMTALTQERDQLRALLEQTREALRVATAKAEAAASSHLVPPPSAAVPLPPPPPPSGEPMRTVPSVPKPVVTNLLADIRKGKTLKPSAPAASPSESSSSSSGLADTLASALAARRGALSGTKKSAKEEEEDREADKAFDLAAMEAVSCEMCYSAATEQCAQCKVAYYCSRDCQVQHWTDGGHKHTCA